MDCRKPTWEPKVGGYLRVEDRRGVYLPRSELSKGRRLAWVS
jgi:hypothetical protein